VLDWYVPAKQAVHPVAPTLDWYVSAPQLAHDVDPAVAEYVPAGQLTVSATHAPPLQFVPAGQALTQALPSQLVPPGHWTFGKATHCPPSHRCAGGQRPDSNAARSGRGSRIRVANTTDGPRLEGNRSAPLNSA
jgi:hypothetical protein